MPTEKIKLAIASDLHYGEHVSGQCMPQTAQNSHDDPMASLLKHIEHVRGTAEELSADFLLCPGDIADKANSKGMRTGWEKLKELQAALGATSLLAATGNHEVNSRPNAKFDVAGQADEAVDPMATLQALTDYPSPLLTGDSRWIYWGRGYEFIEQGDVMFLLINSSHFHGTTRPVEFERGKISDVALDLLRQELKQRVDPARHKVYVALLHHHPVPHVPVDIPQERIEMYNGPQLMEVLEETQVCWLVVHGHKHHGRLTVSQGAGAVVFAAGSFGAKLTGTLPLNTKLQFYILELEKCDQSIIPTAQGRVRALSWSGTSWATTTERVDGIANDCGFRLPHGDLRSLVQQLKSELDAGAQSYITWTEAVARLPGLGNIWPTETQSLRKAMAHLSINSTWPDSQWLPTNVSV
jgi:predicted MPP superfamily phosphohydrolase